MVFKRGEGQFNSEKLIAAITIQRKGRDGKPVADTEPVTEELTYGPITKFHAGNASSLEDPDPEDLGDDAGAEGNCVYAIEGGGSDKKAKISVWGKSLEEAGVRPVLLNGYAPALIGLDADWEQLVTGEKMEGAKNDPTCLIVKRGGTIHNLSEINKRASGGTGGTATTKPAATTPKPTASAAASAKSEPTPAPATTASAPSDGGDEAEAAAFNLVVGLPGKTETVTTRAKLNGKLALMMAKAGIPPKQHKPIKSFFDNAAWLNEKLGLIGAVVEGDKITIPAAESEAA